MIFISDFLFTHRCGDSDVTPARKKWSLLLLQYISTKIIMVGFILLQCHLRVLQLTSL